MKGKKKTKNCEEFKNIKFICNFRCHFFSAKTIFYSLNLGTCTVSGICIRKNISLFHVKRISDDTAKMSYFSVIKCLISHLKLNKIAIFCNKNGDNTFKYFRVKTNLQVCSLLQHGNLFLHS